MGDWRDPLTRTGRAVWTRRGDVFAVRPSRREPFTPYRLIIALREAGFADDQVVLLPTDYDAADEILRGADLGMAYGGDDVVRKYAADTTVLPQGPGRAKILITAEPTGNPVWTPWSTPSVSMAASRA